MLGLSGTSSACHTAILLPFQFLTQHQNLNHTKQRLLEISNYVDQVGDGGWEARPNGSHHHRGGQVLAGSGSFGDEERECRGNESGHQHGGALGPCFRPILP